jgi:hypothetical protein
MVRVVSVDGLVRLQFLNLCPHRIGHISNHLLDSVRRERLRRLANWEPRFFAGAFPVSENEIPCQVVEDCAEIVQCVAEPERELLGRRIWLSTDTPRVLHTFRIKIVNDYTWLRSTEVADGIAKGFQVLVSPYNLGLEATQGFHRSILAPDFMVRQAYNCPTYSPRPNTELPYGYRRSSSPSQGFPVFQLMIGNVGSIGVRALDGHSRVIHHPPYHVTIVTFFAV